MKSKASSSWEESGLKATGIVRKIDDLGRLVIPKEIRRTLRIREGDPVEIFTDSEGGIILKKFSPIREQGKFVKECADSLAKSSGHLTFISDKDQIVAAAGGAKREFLDKQISGELEKAINERAPIVAERSNSKFVRILDDDSDGSYNHQVIVPIISEGDTLGAILFVSNDKNMGDVEEKLALTTAGFLGKQV